MFDNDQEISHKHGLLTVPFFASPDKHCKYIVLLNCAQCSSAHDSVLIWLVGARGEGSVGSYRV